MTWRPLFLIVNTRFLLLLFLIVNTSYLLFHFYYLLLHLLIIASSKRVTYYEDRLAYSILKYAIIYRTEKYQHLVENHLKAIWSKRMNRKPFESHLIEKNESKTIWKPFDRKPLENHLIKKNLIENHLIEKIPPWVQGLVNWSKVNCT
jgi:hypothetical protein